MTQSDNFGGEENPSPSAHASLAVHPQHARLVRPGLHRAISENAMAEVPHEAGAVRARSSSAIIPSMFSEEIDFSKPFSPIIDTPTIFNHRDFRKKVDKIDPLLIGSIYIKTLIEFLKHKCEEHKFISVAANQFGVYLDLFVYKVLPREEAGPAYQQFYGEGEGAMDWQVCINSSWRPCSDSNKFLSKEGSFARRSSLDTAESSAVEVERYEAIVASWTNESGFVITKKLPKFAGNVFQNKVDYNAGMTQVDRHSSIGESSDYNLPFDSQGSPLPIVDEMPHLGEVEAPIAHMAQGDMLS